MVKIAFKIGFMKLKWMMCQRFKRAQSDKKRHAPIASFFILMYVALTWLWGCANQGSCVSAGAKRVDAKLQEGEGASVPGKQDEGRTTRLPDRCEGRQDGRYCSDLKGEERSYFDCMGGQKKNPSICIPSRCIVDDVNTKKGHCPGS